MVFSSCCRPDMVLLNPHPCSPSPLSFCPSPFSPAAAKFALTQSFRPRPQPSPFPAAPSSPCVLRPQRLARLSVSSSSDHQSSSSEDLSSAEESVEDDSSSSESESNFHHRKAVKPVVHPTEALSTLSQQLPALSAESDHCAWSR
ncbi:hypothetical protein OIU85_008872 [Salix viminalis]|uniref:Uncharacterized protein n=1 Tax=Salix viminalis TaxID=40686 RepID=A0A9Q0NYK8_SALVM|nr:hypothetical protein OIU85_008872 [Salix viminalis]